MIKNCLKEINFSFMIRKSGQAEPGMGLNMLSSPLIRQTPASVWPSDFRTQQIRVVSNK